MRTTKARRTPKVDDKRLLAYAAAAGVALAAGGMAEASIIHTNIDATLAVNNSVSSYTLNLPASGAVTFNIYSSGGPFAWANASKAAMAVRTNRNRVFNFSAGSLIEPSWPWWRGSGDLFTSAFFNPSSGGYMGIKFDLSGTPKYGWVNIDSIADDYSSYHLKDWAYQTDGTAIAAGDVGGPSAVPEPSTLAMLALGAGGLAVMRRRKKPEQVQ
jgi:hypothetical protein